MKVRAGVFNVNELSECLTGDNVRTDAGPFETMASALIIATLVYAIMTVRGRFIFIERKSVVMLR